MNPISEALSKVPFLKRFLMFKSINSVKDSRVKLELVEGDTTNNVYRLHVPKEIFDGSEKTEEYNGYNITKVNKTPFVIRYKKIDCKCIGKAIDVQYAFDNPTKLVDIYVDGNYGYATTDNGVREYLYKYFPDIINYTVSNTGIKLSVNHNTAAFSKVLALNGLL